VSDNTSRDRQSLAHAAADEMRSPDALLDTIPIPEITPSAAERFVAKISAGPDPDTCWDWTGSRDSNGYGAFSIGRRGYRAHRVSYAWMNGPIPAGLTIDHLCRNRACVRPEHLAAKSSRENTLAGDTLAADRLKREACPRGHSLVDTNLVAKALRRGERECRICNVVSTRARMTVRDAGGNVEAQRAASRSARDALTGDETIESLGLAPYPIHYALGLVESQPRLDLEIVRSP